jgi:hypothetical protein
MILDTRFPVILVAMGKVNHNVVIPIEYYVELIEPLDDNHSLLMASDGELYIGKRSQAIKYLYYYSLLNNPDTPWPGNESSLNKLLDTETGG